MNPATDPDKSELEKKSFMIVGIGASAGGLEAVTELIENIPPDTGMAFVYIQHLNPDYPSHLAEILQKKTQLSVREAEDNIPIEQNVIYVIPAKNDLFVVDGTLRLKARSHRPARHMPIDQFFTSLAEVHREGAIGVLLSGNAADGTEGLRAIKTAGGFTFAQDDSAQFKSMPASAIAQGAVDMILAPTQIANELVRISRQSLAIRAEQQTDDERRTSDEAELRTIIQLLKKSTGVDFAHYKINTIKRRIFRRMILYRLERLQDYTQYLRQHANEVNTLYNDLLINVTTFFRDPDTMEYVKKTLLPGILKSKQQNDPVRIWVPACSTGEEPYSIAMLLLEILGEKVADIPIQIFATDLSEIAVAKARLGTYTSSQIAEVSEDRVRRFFTKTDGNYRIIKTIRDLCIFAPHNIFKDPPFSRIDLISCCNLMIYLDAFLQKKMLSVFHYALNSPGYLVLGKSETISTATNLFTQLEKRFKIYARKKEPDERNELDISYRFTTPKSEESLKTAPQKETSAAAFSLEKLIDKVLLTNYTPASIVVNQDLEILQFRGSTGLFLKPSSGKASFNLMKMTRPELAFELRNAIHKSSRTGEPVKKSGLQVKVKRNVHDVSIEVVPITTETEEKLFIVVFEETKEGANAEQKAAFTKDKYIKQLQDEIARVREDMRSIVEEQEASREELQSANEEVVSSNEELQSINEELETSKEEVESANEELMTINSELQLRNEQLVESYEYAEAMFGIIREAVLVLDESLRVKAANNAFYSIFQLQESNTIGALLYELDNKQWNLPNLRDMLEKTAARGTEISDYRIVHLFQSIGEKELILNARKIYQKNHQQQVILFAIEDVTEHAKAEKLLKEREEWFRNLANDAPVMIWLADTDKSATFFNSTWLQYTGRMMEQEQGEHWTENVHPEDRGELLRKFYTAFDDKKPFTAEFRLKHRSAEYRWVKMNGKPSYSISKQFTGFINTTSDIHEQKLAVNELDELVAKRTQALQRTNAELERSNNELQQFAYVASHDLQEPLRKIITFCDRLQKFKEILPDPGKKYLEKIEASSEKMTRLIDDLLDFSRATRLDNKFERTDLNKILADVISDFEVIMTQKNAKIVFADLPLIEAIPVQMEQLFHNLVSNSLKFTRDGENPVITISAHELPGDEIKSIPELNPHLHYYRIVLKDNGIGFSPQYREQIFEIFQRLNEQKVYPGTGIGLALCRKIVSNHLGKISAQSLRGDGAEFHIILPEKQS